MKLNWPAILTTLLSEEQISVSQAEWAMAQIMQGSATGAQQGAFLTALNAKGVKVGDLVGFRDAILSEAVPLDLPTDALDIVGTGGDRVGTVNVSTMASLVCAAAGVPVIKHGNKAASSKSGSSDVLSQLGAKLELNADQLKHTFETTKVAFSYTPRTSCRASATLRTPEKS
jgi:anthranilate phosphoribosyltransferase